LRHHMHRLAETDIDQEPRLPRGTAVLIYVALALLAWVILIALVKAL
jgi:hypothetical protein